MKDDRLYLIHITECIERIERYTAAGHAAFLADTMIQDAVLRNLHTLSESTQQLSDALKARHPEVDWPNIAAFRNVIVHDYLDVDLAQIWHIVERDLPDLKRAIVAMLEEQS
jgi:uncharacterized protein with HEPN domain